MEVKVSYSKPQLETAVKFIARNNAHFLGQTDYIRDKIVKHMKRIALDPEAQMSGTMGYMLISDKEFEGFDCDQNTCFLEIWVDPSLGLIREETEYVEEVLNG